MVEVKGSHAIYLSQPEAVAPFIEQPQEYEDVRRCSNPGGFAARFHWSLSCGEVCPGIAEDYARVSRVRDSSNKQVMAPSSE